MSDETQKFGIETIHLVLARSVKNTGESKFLLGMVAAVFVFSLRLPVLVGREWPEPPAWMNYPFVLAVSTGCFLLSYLYYYSTENKRREEAVKFLTNHFELVNPNESSINIASKPPIFETDILTGRSSSGFFCRFLGLVLLVYGIVLLSLNVAKNL